MLMNVNSRVTFGHMDAHDWAEATGKTPHWSFGPSEAFEDDIRRYNVSRQPSSSSSTPTVVKYGYESYVSAPEVKKVKEAVKEAKTRGFFNKLKAFFKSL